MRKAELSLNEIFKYDVIKKSAETAINLNIGMSLTRTMPGLSVVKKTSEILIQL